MIEKLKMTFKMLYYLATTAFKTVTVSHCICKKPNKSLKNFDKSSFQILCYIPIAILSYSSCCCGIF